NAGQCVGDGDVLANAADDDGELGLVVDLGGGGIGGRDDDGVAGILHRGGRLHEEHGALGHAFAALLGVFAVVESDSEDVGRHDRREELAGGHDAVGRAVGAGQWV